MTEPTDAEILELASQYWHCLDETESATEIELVRAALAKWGQPAQEAEPLLNYAMQIAHERELRVTGFPHDEDEAKRIFEAAVMRHTATVAAQADSVQEDAARLDWLIEQQAYVVSDPDACPGHWLHWARPDGSTWVQGDEHPTPRAAIDAARKQGKQ